MLGYNTEERRRRQGGVTAGGGREEHRGLKGREGGEDGAVVTAETSAIVYFLPGWDLR